MCYNSGEKMIERGEIVGAATVIASNTPRLSGVTVPDWPR
jgi:hypothetical protein